jgi:hypothetical protein
MTEYLTTTCWICGCELQFPVDKRDRNCVEHGVNTVDSKKRLCVECHDKIIRADVRKIKFDFQDT